MKVSIHQSQYIPWPAYFKKIAISDKFIILDDVQYQKNGVQNRNKLRNKHGEFWLTIPVGGSIQEKINEKKCSEMKWKKKHFQSITQSYSKSKGWKAHHEAIEDIFLNSSEYLNEINISFIKYFVSFMEIETELFLSSQMNSSGSKSDLVLSLCKELNATEYISGIGAKDYLDLKTFRNNSIKIDFIKSINPSYNQVHGNFIPNLSFLDMLMNVDKTNIVNYFVNEKAL